LYFDKLVVPVHGDVVPDARITIADIVLREVDAGFTSINLKVGFISFGFKMLRQCGTSVPGSSMSPNAPVFAQ
jgi:hypothetical protein